MGLSSRRVLEWSILAVVVLVMMGIFGRQVQIVQGQAELATIKSTLGSIRTAFVLDHLMQQVEGNAKNVASGQRNPFLLMKAIPSNYVEQAVKGELPSGSWMFDAECVCIAYTPVHSQFLENASADPTLWFRISPPPGPYQIAPTERYVWQGEVLQ
jgi:hypothetical protein